MHAPAALHLEETAPLDGLLAAATLVLGVVGLALIAADAFSAGAVAGAAGVFTGLWGQLVSRTRPERFVDVIGLVAAALAAGIGVIS